MRRRGFVVSLGAITVVGCKEDEDGAPVDPDASLHIAGVVRAYFGDELDDVRFLGARYRLRFESDDALGEDLGPLVELLAQEPTVDDAVEALRTRVEADFQASRMLLVDGWALGAAETRMAALAEYVDA